MGQHQRRGGPQIEMYIYICLLWTCIKHPAIGVPTAWPHALVKCRIWRWMLHSGLWMYDPVNMWMPEPLAIGNLVQAKQMHTGPISVLAMFTVCHYDPTHWLVGDGLRCYDSGQSAGFWTETCSQWKVSRCKHPVSVHQQSMGLSEHWVP